MLLLVALCGWLNGGRDGAVAALASGALQDDELELTPGMLERRFGARALRAFEAPLLHQRLREICQRARLARIPELYCLPEPLSMNAYALGGATRSVIVLTQGLLSRMTMDEVSGILAHEVAHIRNNDAWAMSFAAKLQRAMTTASLAALMAARGGGWPAGAAVLLSSAPAIGQLLYQALSRLREFDADALALDLIDDPQSLVAALQKLERFHSGARFPSQAAVADGFSRLLHSHPATSERVSLLARLAG